MRKLPILTKLFFKYLREMDIVPEILEKGSDMYVFEYKRMDLYICTDVDDDEIYLAGKWRMRGMPEDKVFNFKQAKKCLPEECRGFDVEYLEYGDCCISRRWNFNADTFSMPQAKLVLDEMFAAMVGLIKAVRMAEHEFGYY